MALTKVSTGLLSTELSSVDLSIDAGTLYIDSTQNFVGISNTSPTTQLDVTGNLKVSGTSQVGALTFTSLTNTTNDITEGANNKYFTDARVAAIIPAGSLAGTIGNVKMQYRPDGNYDAAAGSAVAGSFYFDALNSRLKVHTGSEFIDAIPFTAGGGGGSTADANATFVNYQYTVTGSPTNTISGADTQELPSGDYIIGKSYEISSPGTTDFTTFGSADNVSGTQFVATGSGLVTAGDFVIGDEYTIVYEGDSGTETNFVLVGATDSNPGTTFTATNNGSGTGTATQGSGTAHAVLGYSTTSASDVVVYVNGIKQRKSSVDGYQATSGTSVGFTYNLPVDSIVDIQVYELLTNDAYYTKLETYTQAETNTQISTALSVYDDQTASDTRYVNVTGDTMTGNLSFGDNDKAIFGAGSDLQIYHDGSNSVIQDSGTGNLNIIANEFALYEGNGTDLMIGATPNGAVTLSHNATTKLATTATGIDVTGTATMDGLTVDGEAHISAALPRLILNETDATDLNTAFRNNSGVLKMQTVNDAANSFTSRVDIDHSSGDVSFYEDTGTSRKLYWDASTERLGLGTTSPSAPLDVRAENIGGETSILVYNTDNSNTTTQSARIKLGPDSRGGALAGMQAYKSTADYTLNTGRDAGLKLYTMNNNVEVDVMTMTNVGTVGIGQDVPSSQLHINASGSSSIKFERSANIVGVELATTTSGGWGLYDYASTSYDVYMKAGQVSIGDVSPTATLDLTKTSDTAERAIRIENNSARLYVGVEGAAGNRFSGSAVGNGFIGTTTAHGLEFGTNNAVRMRIDIAGNVGIGVVPSTVWSSSYDALQIGLGGSVYAHESAGSNMQIAANVVYEGLSPNFYDKYLTSSTASKYVQDSGLHIWSIAASGTAGNNIAWSEAMRINASGTLLMGQTSESSTDTGHIFNPIGVAFHIRDGGVPLVAVRKTDDGELVQFKKDTAVVGSIGIEAGGFYIDGEASHAGLSFGGNSIAPRDNGVRVDNTIDLGSDVYRFKDLYLSGGVVFGATGGAVTSKTLDDYEEGTWTPAFDSVSGLTNVTGLSDIDARYTRVGNTVQAHFTYKLTNSGSETITAGDYFIITNASLPFAPHTYVTSGSIDQFIGDHVWYQSIGTNNIASGSVLWGTGGTYLHFGVINGTPDTGTSAYGLVRLQYDIS